jgi:hypothetical protein
MSKEKKRRLKRDKTKGRAGTAHTLWRAKFGDNFCLRSFYAPRAPAL